MLTYNVKSDGKRWAHLVDMSAGARFSKTATSGSVSAGGSGTFGVSFDTTGLAKGLYPVLLTFASNDPDEPVYEKEIYFLVHEDAPNNPPVADAGPDQRRTIYGSTAPFVLRLEGGGSSDPDGDPLRMTWSWTATGEPLDTGESGLIELAPGTYGLTLTVEDYRGGSDTDEMLFIVERTAPKDWEGWHGTMGTGHACETNENWLQNWPPVVEWVNYGISGSHSGLNVSDGRVYYVAGHRIHCIDAYTGKTIWSHPFDGGDGTSAVDDKYVYAPTRGNESGGSSDRYGRVYCYDKFDGALIWSTGEIGPGYVWDANDEYGSITALGDVVFYGKHALNRYTGEILWSGYRTVHWKPFDWDGHTRILNGGSGKLYDCTTGEEVLYAGPRVRNKEGWYSHTQTHGTDKIWTIDEVWQVGGSKISDFGDVGAVTYTQPFTMGDDGWFVAGGHGCGGQVYHVNLNNGTRTAAGVGVGTMIAVRDKVIGQKGPIYLIEKTATGVNTRTFTFDSGGRGYAEPAYADQRIYYQAADGLTCLYVGLRAPVVENRSGLWNAATRQATMSGRLVNTGGAPASGLLYWGRTDGGTNAAAWDHCVDAGALSVGLFSHTVPNVPTNTMVFFRCRATNVHGSTWASGKSMRVSTHIPETVDARDELLLHWAFDEGTGVRTFDRSGNGHHGDITINGLNGKWMNWTNGVIGGALNVTRARIGSILPERHLVAPLEENWTVTLWVNYTNASGTFFLLTEYPRGHPAGSGSTFTLGVSGDQTLQAKDKKSHHTSTPLHDGQWHHLAVVRSDGTTEIHIDGIRNLNWASPDVGWTYRGFIVAPSEALRGVTFDDVRIYGRALGAAEIGALAQLAGGSRQQQEWTLAAGSADAQEAADGAVSLDGTELDVGADSGGDSTTVGLRFTGVQVPKHAAILSAHIQFASSSAAVEEAVFGIHAQASGDAPAFAASTGNLTSRPRTGVGVSWVPVSWDAGVEGMDQRTPNLAGIVQELVDREDWSSGNAVVFLVNGLGRRVADAQENASGKAPRLLVEWTDVDDVDGDMLPDAWERTAVGMAAGSVLTADDLDGDGMLNWREYIAGTDASDPADLLKLGIRSVAGGQVAVSFDGRAAEGPGYDGLSRYYSLLTCAQLPTSPGSGVVETVWHEDFDLPDGTTVDDGSTAWTAMMCYPQGMFMVTNGMFHSAYCARPQKGWSDDSIWRSEAVETLGEPVDVSVDIRCNEGVDSGDWIEVLYSLDRGGEVRVASRVGQFNGGAWETVGASGLVGSTVEVIVRVKSDSLADIHWWDNVRITRRSVSDWPCVPGLSNVLVDRECTLSHTNAAPGKTGFYRLKVGLE